LTLVGMVFSCSYASSDYATPSGYPSTQPNRSLDPEATRNVVTFLVILPRVGGWTAGSRLRDALNQINGPFLFWLTTRYF
jgi:hypothetical protein